MKEMTIFATSREANVASTTDGNDDIDGPDNEVGRSPPFIDAEMNALLDAAIETDNRRASE